MLDAEPENDPENEEMTTIADLVFGLVIMTAVAVGGLWFGQCRPAPSAPGCTEPMCEAAR
jgi:hypothetical protein